MKDFLKWALLAAGGYLAIRATGITLPTFGGAPDTEPNRVPPGDKTPPVDDAKNTTSTNQTDAAEREVITRRAAAGDAASIQKAVALGIKFNADQWNWYRQQETGTETTVDLFPAGDRAALLTAAEYIARRQSAGLGWLGRRRF